MSYRDTAVQLAQRAPGNFIGVVVYVPSGDLPARWNVTAHPSLAAIKGWYEEIAGAPTLYYYLSAFDKTQGALPVAETIAPPKPGDPGWPGFARLRDLGYQWRPNPFGAAIDRRPTISGAEPSEPRREPRWFVPAFLGTAVGIAWFATSRAVKKIERERHVTK